MNIVKLTNCTVCEDARFSPAKEDAAGKKTDERLWFRLKEAETEGGWFNIWPIVIWGTLATKLASVLKKGTVVSHIIATCKVVAEKDDAGRWSNYVELRPVRGSDGTYREDAVGTITQPQPAPAAPAPDGIAALLAALGPQGMALLAQMAAQMGAAKAQAPTEPEESEPSTDSPFA